MQKIPTIIVSIFVFLLPLFLLSGAIHFVAFDESFYNAQFEKLRVYDSFSEDVVLEQSSDVRNYLKGDGVLDSEFFNAREIHHLEDVKNLLWLNKISGILLGIILLACILVLMMRKEWITLSLMFKTSGIVTMVITVVVSLIAFLGFRAMFIAFHEVAFSNNLWNLNPAVDNLIVLFPEGFFIAAFTRVLVSMFLIALIIMCLGMLVNKTYQKFK